MAILKSAVKLILREHASRKFVGPALSLGVAEVYVTKDELQRWCPELGGTASQLKAGEAEFSINKIGRRLGWVTAQTFMRAIGIDKLESLDVPGCEYEPEITHDLNNPLPVEHHDKYNFLLDPGTLEHVFDQRRCLESIAQALKVGGTVVHLVPIYSYNGGYFSINPNVLHDFYGKNGFDQVKAYIIMWDRFWPFAASKSLCYEYRHDVLGSRHALADGDQVRFTPHLLFFARKAERRAELVAPLQFDGDYVGQAAANSETRVQGVEQIGRKLVPLVQRLLPLQLAIYLQSRIYRILVLRRARRVASFKI